MESIKQFIRTLAAAVHLRPKVFVLVCSVLVLMVVGGVYGIGKTKQSNSAAVNQATSPQQSSVSNKTKNLTESEENASTDQDYHPQDPADEPKDSPSLEIKADGTSNKNFAGIMIRTDGGQPTKAVNIQIVASGLNLADCTLTQKTTFDNESMADRTSQLKAVASQSLTLEDAQHTFTVDCKQAGVSSTMNVLIADGQPERCKGFAFSESAVTAHSTEELRSGIVGTWKGCVSTPWVPTYEVTINFKADGSYDSYSNETLDGQKMIGLYYGTDSNNANKKYQILNFGSGKLTIYFDNSQTTVTDDLQDIKLMGDKLSFSFKHLTSYGPLTFQLYRQ